VVGAYGDDDNGSLSGSAYVYEELIPPTATIDIDPYLAPVGSEFTFDGSTSYDPDGTIVSYNWDFGDESSDNGSIVTHTYTATGVYTVTLTVTDDDGLSGQSVFEFVVVYDSEGGFVTGGGWIYSEAGADKVNPSAEGKATFGFVSKYKKGANVPTGQTEFQFKAGDLNFHSSDYEWLVVTQAGTNAQFKGTGTINGTGEYKFMLWAGDGDPDTFRIRIWEEDEFGNELVVYDNGFDQAVVGGSIVINKSKK
jgi:PKD repeat protein